MAVVAVLRLRVSQSVVRSVGRSSTWGRAASKQEGGAGADGRASGRVGRRSSPGLTGAGT